MCTIKEVSIKEHDGNLLKPTSLTTRENHRRQRTSSHCPQHLSSQGQTKEMGHHLWDTQANSNKASMFFLLWLFHARIACGGDETFSIGRRSDNSQIIRSNPPKLQAFEETLIFFPDSTYKIIIKWTIKFKDDVLGNMYVVYTKWKWLQSSMY